MNSEDKLFDLMTKMYADLKDSQEKMHVEMKEGFESVNDRLNKVENRLDNVESRLGKVEKITLSIEEKHGEKLQALFDGYIQNSDKLDRIEKEVSKHDEIILRKVNP